MRLRQGRSFICLPMFVWLSNEVSACRGLAVVWLTRGTCPSFESGVLATVPTTDRRTQ